MKRRLRLFDSPHARTWEISVEGCAILLRAGLENTPGVLKRIERLDEAAAVKTAEQLIAQRLADGFTDWVPDAAWAALTPQSDSASWAVYADSLLAQGDVRGELIALQLGGDEKRAQALIKNNAEALLGDLTGVMNQVELTWEHGFITTALVKNEPKRRHVLALDQVIAALFNSPSIRMLQRLELGWPGPPQLGGYDAAMQMLCHRQWPQYLETLEIGSFDPGARRELPALTSLAAVAHRKQLKYLVVRSALSELHRLSHPGLRHLELDVPALTHRVFDDLLQSDLPALRGVVLNVGQDSVLKARHLTALASPRFLPGVAALGVRHCRDAISLVEKFVSEGRLARLSLLDLSENSLNETDGQWLLKNSRHFVHLAKLVLKGNLFKPRMAAKLAAALPNSV